MKADLTRDTFHPWKHFDRVLMQQGRVQLDADWNEQAEILLRYVQKLTLDLIGRTAGPTPPSGQIPGFVISKLSGVANDLRIGFGDYFVDGLLCEADFMPIAISQPSAAGVCQVINWSPDFDQTPIPPFEVYDDTPGTPNLPVVVTVTVGAGQKAHSQITIAPTFSNFTNPKLRRLITYLHQPDFVYNTTANAVSPPPLPATPGVYQIYLDVWDRVITYAEDDSIREVALGGPDTAVRTKRVWQVKWAQPPAGTPACSLPFLYGTLQPPNRGWMMAMAKQANPSTDPCIINPNASYTGPENQLYRVEINRFGGPWNGNDPADQTAATFKWSRENGSAIYPIASGGGTAMVVVDSLGRDDRFGLDEGNLVEVQDDRTVLMNLAGNLLTVQGIDPSTLTVSLGGAPDPNTGSNLSWHPLLRRWDQTAGDPAEGGLTLANDNCAFVQEGQWLELEDGVQVWFKPALGAATNQYRTGDYWLIPARTATGDVEWPTITDAQGNSTPLALPPHGVTHHYAPLATLNVNPDGMAVTDCPGFDTGQDT
jgi:hypothetical protein